MAKTVVFPVIEGEKLYTCNGVLEINGPPARMLDQLLKSMDGDGVYSQGVWNIWAAGPATPETDVIDESWLNGGISFKRGSNKNEKINTAGGTYVNPLDYWAATGFPTVAIPAYIADDQEELTADLTLNFCTSGFQAQRMARLAIERSRSGMVVNYPCNLKALQVKVNEVRKVSNTRLGWNQKLFRVLDWQFTITGGVLLTLGEENPDMYDIPGSSLQPLPTPDPTTLPDPWTVTPPTNLTATESLYTGVALANTKSKLTLGWVSTSPAGTQFEVAVGGTIIQTVGDTLCVIPDLAPGSYDISVRAKNSIGAVSPWVSIAKTVLGKVDPPANVAGFSAAFAGNLIKLTWTANTDVDLVGYEIRVGASWAAGTVLLSAHMGTGYTYRPSGAGTLTYWIKALDTAGNQSATAASASAVIPYVDVPSAITTSGRFLGIDVQVIHQTDRLDTAYTELWAAVSNDRATAVQVGVIPGAASDWSHTGLSNGAVRYYWARCISVFGQVGAWYPDGATAGAIGLALNDPSAMMALLHASLTPEELVADLQALFLTGNINGVPTLGLDGDMVVDGTIHARSLVTDELVVGDNITMGPNAVLQWAQVADKPEPRGAWSSTFGAYIKGDTVFHNNSSYVCILGHTAATGKEPTNATYWSLLAAAGFDGYNTSTVTIYKRSTSAPALPTTTGTYTFSTASISGLDNGWTKNIPAGTDDLYAAVATAVSRTDTDSITAAEWSTPTILSTVGADGAPGLNSATVYLFQRTATSTPPSKPASSLTYTFSTGVLSGTLGSWTQTLPTTGGAYRWMTTATAASTASTDTILSTEWATPAILANDGATGATGSQGQGQVKGVSFLRSLAAPATPTGGTFAAPNATGWSDGIPADNNLPLWMTSRIFTSDGLSPQQAVWTTPAKIGTPSTGTKTQFSIDGSTLWHDVPAVSDQYMRTGTSTDNGATWTYSGSTKIKGETGATGSQGPQGVQGATGAAGVNAITVALSNDAHTVPAATDGTVSSYTGSGTDIVVYELTTALSYVTSLTGPSQFTVSASTSGITCGAISAGTGKAVVAQHSAMTTNPASVTYTITARRADNTTITITKKQTITKSVTGATGSQGPQGIQGPQGPQGEPTYTWLKYADTPTTGMSDSPTGKTYMGLAYNKSTPTESTNYADYSWSLIKGEQGVQGPTGPTGAATYTWIKYANDAVGTGMSDSPTGKTYIGIAYNKSTAVESSVAGDYAWSLIQGEAGADSSSYWLTASPDKIINKEGVFTPATVTFTANTKTGAGTPGVYAGRFKVYQNGVLTYTSASNESSTVVTPLYDTVSIKCEMFLAGGVTTKLDEQTILALTDQSQNIVDALNAGGKVYTQPADPYPIHPTFTRATPAFRLDGTPVSSGTPRMEEGKFGTAILIEEATTNLCLFDTETSTTAGLASDAAGTVIAISTAQAYSGTKSVSVLNPTLGFNVHCSGTAKFTQTAGTSFTFSVKIKRADGLPIPSSITGYLYVFGNTNAGMLGITTPLKDGWHQCVFTRTGLVSGAVYLAGIYGLQAGVTYYLDDWQVEAKWQATSFVTPGATRNRDDIDLYPPALSPAAGSLEMWIKPLAGKCRETITYSYLFSTGVWSPLHRFYAVHYETRQIAVVIGDGTTDRSLISAVGTAPVGQWSHIAITWSATTGLNVYINGVKTGENTGIVPSFDTGMPFCLGRYVGGSCHFNGLIDDVRFSSVVRTAEEIFANYQSMTPNKRDAYTTLLLPFDTKDVWVDNTTSQPVTMTYDGVKWVSAATVGAPAGTYVGNQLAETLVSDAATAKSNATTALANAATANSLLSDIASDSKLVPSEKHLVLKEWDIIYSEKAGIESQATAFSITTEKTAYTDAFRALGTYLNGVNGDYTIGPTPPLWITDAQLSVTTDVTGSTFRTNWKTLYDARTALLNAIAAKAATTATWATVTGTGKPADNATKNTAYSQSTLPASPQAGDTWFNTNTADNLPSAGYFALTGYTYNGSAWIPTTPRGTWMDANGIYTGTLTANRVNTSGFTAQTANIADAAITTGKIANLAVTNALINNAAVNTLQVADGAIIANWIGNQTVAAFSAVSSIASTIIPTFTIDDYLTGKPLTFLYDTKLLFSATTATYVSVTFSIHTLPSGTIWVWPEVCFPIFQKDATYKTACGSYSVRLTWDSFPVGSYKVNITVEFRSALGAVVSSTGTVASGCTISGGKR